jgi:hypothetical protein
VLEATDVTSDGVARQSVAGFMNITQNDASSDGSYRAGYKLKEL